MLKSTFGPADTSAGTKESYCTFNILVCCAIAGGAHLGLDTSG